MINVLRIVKGEKVIGADFIYNIFNKMKNRSKQFKIISNSICTTIMFSDKIISSKGKRRKFYKTKDNRLNEVITSLNKCIL